MGNARPNRDLNDPSAPRFRFPPFEFDPATGLLYQGDEETLLPPKVALVLQRLLESTGELVTKDQLLEDVWQDTSVTDSSLSYTISILRQLLGDDAQNPTYVETLHGRGYRFVSPVEGLGSAPAHGDETAEHTGETGGPVHETDAQPVPAAASTGGNGAPLAPGDKLGSYEIVDVVGAGATGTVYRARDDSLERDVAIKLLAEDFADDPQRLARLEREARLLAALSHPNIAAIHSLEETDGRKVPVLEFVDGETLDERMRSRPPDTGEALRIARDIASALEAAHEQGIIHRDLKPSNVKLTTTGQVKVLDFGLAKRLEVEVLGEEIAASPTTSLTIRARRGSIVGTAAYMSPEQARGQEVDRRADIWSFGCVLYELLTGGSRPFGGDTIADTLASVVGGDPDWTALPAGTPRGVRPLLRRCLRKDPTDRLRDIGDARIEIDDALAAPAGELEPNATEADRSTRRRIVAALSTAAAFVAGGGIGYVVSDRPDGEPPSSTSPPPDDVSAFEFDAPEGLRVSQLSVSPDGRHIVFVGGSEDGRQLYRRPVGGLSIQPIPGTEGARNRPFFSPDGDRLGFFTDDDLMAVRFPGGGDLHTVAADIRGRTEAMSASWGYDDAIVFGHFFDGLFWVPAAGDTRPEPLTTLDDEGDLAHLLPQHVPGTRLLLFTVRRGGFQHAIELIDLDNPEDRRTVIEDARNGHLLHANRLVFERAGDLYSVTFDAETGLPRDGPKLVTDDVWRGLEGAMPAPVAAAGGTLAWMGQNQTYERHTIASWHPDRGLCLLPKSDPLSVSDRAFTSLRLSPTGEKLLLVERLGALDGRLL
ncbi:MAG: protein kinase, partial [Acidobacteriota bacterium]